MAEGRATVVWGRVAAHAAAGGRRVSVADVCEVAVSSAGLSGGWLAAARGGGPDFVMCVTDSVAEQLAELQLMLGEGPCLDVLASAAPVLAADLGDEEFGPRWPAFVPAARLLGAVRGKAVVDLCAITADGTGLFKREDATRGRGGRQTDRFAHLVVGCPAVTLKVAQDGDVELVEHAGRGFRTAFG